MIARDQHGVQIHTNKVSGSDESKARRDFEIHHPGYQIVTIEELAELEPSL